MLKYRVLETPTIKHCPGTAPLEPPRGLIGYPQTPADFLGCLHSFEKSQLTKNLFSGLPTTDKPVQTTTSIREPNA